MPLRIDADARAAQIADASLRVLERDGLTGLSVRGVAEEAGIATASLRRAFPTQHALREHCLLLIEERATARIRALDASDRDLVDQLLAQLLPIDRERRLEFVAQVQLGVLALTDASLRPAMRRLDEAVTRGCELALGLLAESGGLAPSRDLAFETRRLRALLDGIAMGMLWSDSADRIELLHRTLTEHLDGLGREG